MTPAGTLVADPPWTFRDKLPGPGRGAVKHYACLTVDELCALSLPPLADDCRLFLWRVASMQAEALRVACAWGFEVKAELVWLKTKDGVDWPAEEADLRMGMGRQVRNVHEVCLVATRGRPVRLSAAVRSVFAASRSRHSEKPDRFYRRVEALSPGPYVELFARKHRPGWTCLGLEADGRDLRTEAAE